MINVKDTYYIVVREGVSTSLDKLPKKMSIHRNLEEAILAREVAEGVSFIKASSIHGPFGIFDMWDPENLGKRVDI